MLMNYCKDSLSTFFCFRKRNIYSSMFEITTRLPNSFAFKNNPRLLYTNSNKLPSFSISETYSSTEKQDNPNHDLSNFFGQRRSTSSSSNFFQSQNNNGSSSSMNYNSRLTATPDLCEHELHHSDQMKNSNHSNNINFLPVYYRNEQSYNLPSLNRQNSYTKQPFVDKSHFSNTRMLPRLHTSGFSPFEDISHVPPQPSSRRDQSNNFHQELQAHQRRLDSLERSDSLSHQGRSLSLNMNRQNKYDTNNGKSIIYSHDSSEYQPTDDSNKISVIKSIKARQDMFLTKLKSNTEEEVIRELSRKNNNSNILKFSFLNFKEDNNPLKFHYENVKKSRIEDENEMNLIKRNYNYLFRNHNSHRNKTLRNNTYKNSENLNQIDKNSKTLNQTDQSFLRSMKDRQGNIDFLRRELNDTPLSDTSSVASSAHNRRNNSFFYNNSFLNSDSNNGQQKSILIKKNRPHREKKSVSFAES